MKSRLDSIASFALIFASLFVTGDILYSHYYAPANISTRPASQLAGRLIGTKLDVTSVNWKRSRTSIVLVIREGCHFCEESFPFYRVLAKEMQRSPTVGMVIVAPGPIASTRQYLKEHDLADFQIILSSPLVTIHVSGTPTLLLVDSTGTIRRSWLGKLNSAQEQQVIRAIS